MGFISYLVFIIIAIGFVGCVNHKGEWFIMETIIFFILGVLIGCVFRFIDKGEWFIMEILYAVLAFMFGLILGIIMGLAISDC